MSGRCGTDVATRDVLQTLAAAARERVAAAKLQVSAEAMEQAARALPADHTLPFERALRGQGMSFICEAKRASPSRGLISPEFPYLDIARDYEAAGAACISVLTEPTRFQGSDTYLHDIAATVSVPVLRKDFTVDQYQLFETKVLGASAVLLICALLDDATLTRFLKLCDQLGLSALVEAHDETEVGRALAAGARVVGVNNRDLRDFSVNLNTSVHLRPLVPPEVLFVAESGITTPADVARLRDAGVDGVLVGECLMRATNRAAKLAELAGDADGAGTASAPGAKAGASAGAYRQRAERPEPCAKVKVCGLRTAADVDAVNTAHPDYAGFVFAPHRRRNVSLAQAVALRARLDGSITAVGVFVDAPVRQVVELIDSNVVDVVQLHGHEDEDYLAAVRMGCKRAVTIVKAFKLEDEASLSAIEASSADLVVLDGGAGGQGATCDWTLVTRLHRPYALAGGLTCENIGAALAATHPVLVDVSSGVETDGAKDAVKVAGFVEAVRKGHTMEQSRGRFGIHGGQYIPETLMNAVIELEQAYDHFKADPDFQAELDTLLREYAGRPSRLYFAARMTADLGGAKVYLKREDLNHTGSHKINNALGQALLARKMGKTRLIAETGAGQHGVATATAAALMGMECVVFMGKTDTERQALNVYRMELLGATVVPVTSGTATLKDAVSEAMREWTSRIADTHYCLGSVMGPHPFPTMVRDFQAVIGREVREQLLHKEGRLPDAVVACVGGGSNAIGSFHEFIGDADVRLIGCEAAGRGVDTLETAATIATGREGIFHGMKSYFCQDDHGQIAPVYSISAGLDYPGVGPEHAWLHDTGRATYVPITDDEAVDAFEYLSRTEGIIPAIESAHAIAYARKLAPPMRKDQIVVVTLSGRGDKDCAAMARYRGKDVAE